MWAYRLNVILQEKCELHTECEFIWAECGPIDRMWAYRPNVAYRSNVAYRPNVALLDEYRSTDRVLTLMVCQVSFAKGCSCDLSSGVTRQSSLQNFWL